MKKFAIIYAIMLVLSIAVPAAVCFMSRDKSDSAAEIFHSAQAVISAFAFAK